ncbi:MAG TPA: SPOR domain-containing protein [Vicinamibacterales bacterium]|nr:SPOR domain-containing protein [Vicinamibacterales bacterium]
MAGATHDDGFHEIQLNGKQLVFLFMAVTVVSVVIFLCGVLVGRGVRLDRGFTESATVEAAGPEPVPPPAAETVANGSVPTTPKENTTFAGTLSSANPPIEKLKPAADAPTPKGEQVAPDPPAAAPPAPAAAPPSAAAKEAKSGAGSTPAAPSAKAAAPEKKPEAPPNPALAEPQGPGVAVQVSAFRVRGEAEALANRLVGKGYTAYVVAPAPGAPALFRVRVGKFKEPREADRIAQKLKKEEQFDPWIVR